MMGTFLTDDPGRKEEAEGIGEWVAKTAAKKNAELFSLITTCSQTENQPP